MRSYRLVAPAKINLYLEIIGIRSDGYHELVMILQSIDLADLIEIRPSATDTIKIYCEHPEVPCNETNLAYKAAKLMQQQFPEIAANYGGVNIFIDKRIPVAAGLAGGSANAAAVLVGINLIWELGLTQPELQSMAAMLGSDVPFCIGGGTAIATGRGEKLDPIHDLNTLVVVLAKYRSLSVSTAWAYRSYREDFGHTYPEDPQSYLLRSQSVHSGPLVKAIVSGNGAEIGKLIHNDLEKVVYPEYPQVAQLRETMARLGGLGTMMSGSGPTVFTLCESITEAESLKKQLIETMADPELEVWTAKLSSGGIHLAR